MGLLRFRKWLGLSLGLAVPGLLAWPATGRAPGTREKGQAIARPTALAQNLEGRMVEPAEIFAGRPTVLIFMRTDCPISNRYAPVIEKLFQTYGLRVRFWLVYPDAKETAAQISAHQKEFHLSAAPLRDIHLRLASLAGATMTPEAAVFNRGARLIYHGRIDNLYIDATRARANPTSNDLEDAIRASLAGKSVTPDHTAAVGCYIADVAEKPAP